MMPPQLKPPTRNAAILRRKAQSDGLPLVYHPKDDPNTPDMLAYIGDPPPGFGV